jgi:anti-sigma factor RsiW
MDCKDIRRRLSAYIDNELSLKERHLIERHLEQCPICAAGERDLRMVSLLIENIPNENASPFFAEKVVSRAGIGIEKPGRRYLFKPALAGVLVIALLIIGITGLNLENTKKAGFYPYLKNFDDFPPESFSNIYTSSLKGNSK